MSNRLPDNLFLPYQQRWIDDKRPVVFAEKGRQEGFSWCEAYRGCQGRVQKGTNLNFMSRVESVAKQFIADCKQFAKIFNIVAEDMGEQMVVKEKGISATVLRFPLSNGRFAEIRALTSNPDAARGLRGDFTFDEIAFHRDAETAFEAALPSALTWGHQVRAMSTHNGQHSFFNQKLIEIRKGKWDFGIQRVTIDDAIEDGLAEVIRQRMENLPRRPEVDAAWRANWRMGLKSRSKAFDQEYLCIPESEGTAFLPATIARACEEKNLKLTYSPADLLSGKVYYAGYDIGRRHDMSVLWVAELLGDVLWTRMLRVLDRQTFSVQAGLINTLMSNRSIRRICIDETGMGMQLAEQAKERWGSRVEPVSLSMPTKSSIGTCFRDRFSDRLIRIPEYVDWDEPMFDGGLAKIKKTTRTDTWLVDDLSKTKKEITNAGNVRLAADSDDDGHADGFWAGALMNEAASGARSGPRRAALMTMPAGW